MEGKWDEEIKRLIKTEKKEKEKGEGKRNQFHTHYKAGLALRGNLI